MYISKINYTYSPVWVMLEILRIHCLTCRGWGVNLNQYNIIVHVHYFVWQVQYARFKILPSTKQQLSKYHEPSNLEIQ